MILNFHNTEIYYELHGNGPAIVLLHGFLESSSMWKSLIPILAKERTVIILDFPGHGKSGTLKSEHTMELLANLVATILELQKIPSAVIAGHSMGGYVALALAESNDEMVEKLLLINSTPAEDSEERKINRDRALKVIVKNPKAFISMAISNLFPEDSQEFYASEILQLKKEALKFPLKGIISTINGMKNRKDRINVLKNFSKEKIMICGLQDPIVSFNDCKTKAYETKSQLIILDGGHMGMVENFDEIVKIVTLS